MTCAKRNCPQCASVEHTGQEKPAVEYIMDGNALIGVRPAESVWETNAGSSHYEDDGPGRGGYYYTD